MDGAPRSDSRATLSRSPAISDLDKQEECVGVFFFFITLQKWMKPTESLLYLQRAEQSRQTHTQGSRMAAGQSQWARSLEKKKKKVLPAILDDIDLTSKWDLPPRLASKDKHSCRYVPPFFFLTHLNLTWGCNRCLAAVYFVVPPEWVNGCIQGAGKIVGAEPDKRRCSKVQLFSLWLLLLLRYLGTFQAHFWETRDKDPYSFS